MQFYFAPMDGITGFEYRNAHRKFYPGITRYFTPFVVTNKTVARRNKEVQDILPENNIDVPVVPQILTNDAEEFLVYEEFMASLGYTEVNLNAGCPVKRVMNGGRGAGLLADPDNFDRLLDGIFSGAPRCSISIKTRIGITDSDQFAELMEIYNKYPISQLIIHARTQRNLYKVNTTDRNAFALGLRMSRCPVCYNGDLFTDRDIREFRKDFPEVQRIMCGRGLLERPWLGDVKDVTDDAQDNLQYTGSTVQSPETFTDISDNISKSLRTFALFHNEIIKNYTETLKSRKLVLWKMKELWCYWIEGLDFLSINRDNVQKNIRACSTLEEYTAYTDVLLNS